MKNKRIVIKENLNEQENELRKINLFILAVNKIISKFKVDTGYCLSLKDVDTLVFNGPDAVAAVHERVKEFCNKQLDDLNITSLMMRSSFLTDTGKYIAGLSKELNVFHSSPGAQHLNILEMVDGQLILPKDAEEAIRESFRNVINTEQGEKLFNLQKEAAEKLQTLLDFVNDETILHYSNVNHLVQNFFYSDNRSVEMTDLDYQRIVQKAKHAELRRTLGLVAQA